MKTATVLGGCAHGQESPVEAEPLVCTFPQTRGSQLPVLQGHMAGGCLWTAISEGFVWVAVESLESWASPLPWRGGAGLRAGSTLAFQKHLPRGL